MNQYIITIKKNQAGQSFIELARNLDFIVNLEPVKKDKIKTLSSQNHGIPLPKKKGDIEGLFGIWKDYDITLERIRTKAWPLRK